MAAVAQADSTYTAIEKKVRRLTASASEAALSSADIQQAVNTFYNQDFPYAIKIDQQRSVYKFLTIPNVDRYPVDVNNLQGFRGPVYFEGVQGNFFKDRNQLYNIYPRTPTKYLPISGDGVTTNFTFRLFGNNQNPYPQPNFGILSTQVVIGGIDINGNPIRIIDDGGAVVDSVGIGSNTTRGQLLFIQQNNVGNNVYIDNTAGVQTTVSGLAMPDPTPFAPIYETDVLASFRSANPNASVVPGTLQFYINYGLPEETLLTDNGNGILNRVYGPFVTGPSSINYRTSVASITFLVLPGPGTTAQASFRYYPTMTTAGQKPAIPQQSPLPAPSPPLTLTPQYCGTVNYVTTEMQINFPVPPAAGSKITVWAAQYQVGRPYNLLFWNNELTVRPVPDGVYLCEVEVYQTPAQFMQTTDNPTLNQWWQYIAYGAACEILRERQDMEGLSNLMEGFKRQESLVLERQAVEEIQQPNITLFNSTGNGYGYGAGWGIGQGF